MQTAVAAPLLEGDRLRRCGPRAVLILGRDDAILLHAAEHISEAFLGALRMPVGIKEARPLEQPCVVAGMGSAAVQIIATATLGAIFGFGGLGAYLTEGISQGDDADAFSGRRPGRPAGR